jgi:hypothetical protein
MAETRFYSCAAFSFLLLLLLAGSLVVQTAGYALDLSLSPYSLYIALLPGLLVTYGYCFPLTHRHIRVAALCAAALALLGALSRHMLDFSADGLGYQQASVEAIMNGWNPFGHDSMMLWQQIYPSGIWAIEASLAYLYGSVEAAKMLHVWLLFITLPILLFGFARYRGTLNRLQVTLVVLAALSTTVLSQLLTHYVDADAYLAGLIFIGGLLIYGHSRRFNIVSSIIMAASLCLVINAKLSGIYHGGMLSAGAVLFLWVRAKRFPWKAAIMLFAAGLFAVLILGYRPYVTSFIHYGPSLFPDNTESFSGAQRPSSFDGITPPQRFLYSLFSMDGGSPHRPAILKWPWTIGSAEWKFSGDPDPRSGGYGPLFALGFLCSLAIFAYAVLRKFPADKGLMVLAVICLLFSAMFPQSWWARYVPFAYLAPFLLLLAIGSYDWLVQGGLVAVILIFGINSEMSLSAASVLYYRGEQHFTDVVNQLKKKPDGTVYLVPPVFNYKKYNGAYMPLQRRLNEEGIGSVIKPGTDCPRMVEMYSGFAICY